MGTGILAAASKSSSAGSESFIFIILIIFALLYFFMIRPQRNRQRQAQQTQRQVGDGARVRTTSGIYGRIVSGDDQNVMLEVAPGVQVKMMRRAIMNVVPDDETDGIGQTFPDAAAADGSSKSDDREDFSI